MNRAIQQPTNVAPGSVHANIREGAGAIQVCRVAGESAIVSMRCRAPMKILAPRSRGTSVWAFTSSFGGGFVAGDRTSLDIRVDAGARCFLASQASAKVYRCLARRPCSHVTRGTVEANGLLVFAPDPVQPFSQSIYEQQQEFRVHPQAGLVLLDWFTAGRVARGERWAFTRFQSRNSVFVGERHEFLDALTIEPARLEQSRQHSVGRYGCFATLAFFGARVRSCAETMLQCVASRPIDRQASLLVTASPLPHGAVIRIAAQNLEQAALELQTHLKPLRAQLGDDPWSRKT